MRPLQADRFYPRANPAVNERVEVQEYVDHERQAKIIVIRRRPRALRYPLQYPLLPLNPPAQCANGIRT